MSFEPRRLTDARDMRALAHPVRLALVEALGRFGPLTATEAAEHVGESPSSCSFHLRQLAKYGFVEEAGPVPGRRRPWRLTAVGISLAGDQPDPETAIAATALERLIGDRYLGRAQEALDRRTTLEPAWRRATGINQFVLHVTPEELEELDRELVALLSRYHDRFLDPELRPEGSRPIEAVTVTYPLE